MASLNLAKTLPRARDIRRAAAAAPKRREDVEAWRRLLDDELIDERQFLGCFKIRTDLGEDAPEDADGMVPFMFRAWQTAMYESLVATREKRRPAKKRMPKARGTGASSFSLALLGFCRPLRRCGYRFLAIAQDQTESEEHLGRLDDFYQQAFDGGGNEAALRALGITLEVSSRRSKVIKFVDPATGQFLGRSHVRVKTARSKGLGRGGGYDAILTTERPHWPEKCKNDLTGYLSRLTKSRWSAHIDESSPNGLDDFYEDCMSAQKGRGGYELFFIPAYARPENYIRVRSPEEAAEIFESLGKADDLGGVDEVESFHRCVTYWKGLDPYIQVPLADRLDDAAAHAKALEWTKFRREAIEGECRGSVENFHREHGCTLAEAFQGSGRPVLNVTKLRSWMERALGERESWKQYRLEQRSGGEIEAVEDRFGLWSIRDMPKADGVVAYGADCAGGEEMNADGKKESDFSYCVVGEIYSGEAVAELCEHIEPHLYAEEIAKAAQFWRLKKPVDTEREERRRRLGLKVKKLRSDGDVAMGLIEANNDMGGATINTLMMTEFPWGNGLTCVLETSAKVKTDMGVEVRKQYGFRTGPKSKEVLVTDLRRYIDEVGRFEPHKGDARRCPWSYRTLHQMTKYVYKGRKMEAESGHDDGVVAEALMQMSRRMLMEDGRVPLKSKLEKKVIPTEGPRMRYSLRDVPKDDNKRDIVLGAQFD